MELQTSLLRAILSTLARQTYPPEQLARLISPRGKSEKQLDAYNLCDGTHNQAEIASAVPIDKGTLSSAIAGWVEKGIVIRIGDGRDARPLHVYPLTKDQFERARLERDAQ